MENFSILSFNHEWVHFLVFRHNTDLGMNDIFDEVLRLPPQPKPSQIPNGHENDSENE